MEKDLRNRIRKTKKFSLFLGEMKEDEQLGKIVKDIYEQLQESGEEFTQCPVSGEEAILIAGYPALAGCSLLAYHFEKELLAQFPMHFMRQTQNWFEKTKEDLQSILEIRKKLPETNCYLLGEGGLYRKLYQLGKDSQKGYHIHYQAVPVRQEAIEICEFYDQDPWEMMSTGCAVIVTSNAEHVLRLSKEKNLICNRVGYMTKDKDKLICHKTVNSRINRPGPDALLQILQNKLEES